MTVTIINPKNNLPLLSNGDHLIDNKKNSFPIIRGVPRIAELENYTSNFGKQWNKFDKTQFDREVDGVTLSKDRFFAETRWDHEDLKGKDILEVGSGAGRFSKVILEHTEATLYSVDFSDAVTANFKNNSPIAPDRFHLFHCFCCRCSMFFLHEWLVSFLEASFAKLRHTNVAFLTDCIPLNSCFGS